MFQEHRPGPERKYKSLKYKIFTLTFDKFFNNFTNSFLKECLLKMRNRKGVVRLLRDRYPNNR